MDVSEKYILTATNSGEERFQVLLCENKVDGTQNLIYNRKMAPKVPEPTIEKKNGKLEKFIFDYIAIKIS